MEGFQLAFHIRALRASTSPQTCRDRSSLAFQGRGMQLNRKMTWRLNCPKHLLSRARNLSEGRVLIHRAPHCLV